MSEETEPRSTPGIVWLLVGIVLVPLLVVGVAALFVPRVIGHSGDAKRAKAASDVAEIKNALDRFRLACGRYPKTAEGLDALITAPKAKGWAGPYLSKMVQDPWANDLAYRDLGGDKFSVVSYGADGRPGGVGDNEDIGH